MLHLINAFLRRFLGIQVARIRTLGTTHGWDWGDSAKRSLTGIKIGTIIDIGAAHGTPYLYEIDEEAYRIFIEPVRECNNELKHFIKNGNGTIINCAIGDQERTVIFYVDRHQSIKSSLYIRSGSNNLLEERFIQEMPLSRALEGVHLMPPLLIKIDVEGHELETLRGCKDFMDMTAAIIIEVTLDDRFRRGRNDLKPIDSIMKDNGFVLGNVLSAFVRRDISQNRVLVSKVDLLYINARIQLQSATDGISGAVR